MKLKRIIPACALALVVVAPAAASTHGVARGENEKHAVVQSADGDKVTHAEYDSVVLGDRLVTVNNKFGFVGADISDDLVLPPGTRVILWTPAWDAPCGAPNDIVGTFTYSSNTGYWTLQEIHVQEPTYRECQGF